MDSVIRSPVSSGDYIGDLLEANLKQVPGAVPSFKMLSVKSSIG